MNEKMSVTEPLVLDQNCREGYGDTYLNAESFSYTWTIHNFSQTTFRSDATHLQSPIFQTLHNDSIISWYIQFYKDFDYNYSRADISLAVFCEASKQCNISAKAEFSIKNENSEKNINVYGIINKLLKPDSGYHLACKKLLETNRASLVMKNSGFCPNDNLTVKLDIILATDQLSKHKTL